MSDFFGTLQANDMTRDGRANAPPFMNCKQCRRETAMTASRPITAHCRARHLMRQSFAARASNCPAAYEVRAMQSGHRYDAVKSKQDKLRRGDRQRRWCSDIFNLRLWLCFLLRPLEKQLL